MIYHDATDESATIYTIAQAPFTEDPDRPMFAYRFNEEEGQWLVTCTIRGKCVWRRSTRELDKTSALLCTPQDYLMAGMYLYTKEILDLQTKRHGTR